MPEIKKNISYQSRKLSLIGSMIFLLISIGFQIMMISDSSMIVESRMLRLLTGFALYIPIVFFVQGIILPGLKELRHASPGCSAGVLLSEVSGILLAFYDTDPSLFIPMGLLLVIYQLSDAVIPGITSNEETSSASRFLSWLSIVSAIISLVIWYLSSGDLAASISHALSILFIMLSVPCAAAPVAVLYKLMKQCHADGIIARDHHTLIQLAEIDTAAFGLRGILTEGQPFIASITAEGMSQDSFVALAASVESETESTHPIAGLVMKEAIRRRLKLSHPVSWNEVQGCGVEALIYNQPVRFGRQGWLRKEGVHISASLLTRADQIASRGKTVLFLSTGNSGRGFIAFNDPIREDALAAIAALMNMDMKTVLLTGDSPSTAKAAGRSLGLSATRASLSAMEKVRELRILQSHGAGALFMADSRTSLDAMGMADISIAFEGSCAEESADIVLHKRSLWLLAHMIKLARKASARISHRMHWMMMLSTVSILPASGVLEIYGIHIPTAYMALLVMILGLIPSIRSTKIKEENP